MSRFGISLVGSIPWGTHLCQFYESKEDLIDILVPYFAEGLHSNEFCMWITSPPLGVEEAKNVLRKAVPDLDEYLKKGQIEIIPYNDWYLLNGKFDSNRVLQGWVEKEKAALKQGFEGLRLTGNTFWVERDLWNSFVDYEEAINSIIEQHKMLALCTYCLKNCTGADVLDVVRNHVGTLIKQGEKWSLVADVLHRKTAEEALKESEKRLNRSQEIAHLGSWELDLIHDKLTWSDEAYRIFGLKPQEFAATYEAFLDAVHPDDRAAVDAAYSASICEGRDTYAIEHRIVRKIDDEIRVVEEKCEHVRDKSGKVIRSVGMVQDITERKKAENELQQTSVYLENLLNYANAPVIVWDQKFNITLFNHAFENLTGLKLKDVLEKPLEILFPEDRKEEAMAHIKCALEGEYWETVEIPIRDVEGKVRTVLWNSANIYDESHKEVIATIAQGYDITERKQAEQALHRAKVDWERTFNSVPDLIAILDNKHKIVRANKAMAEALAMTQEQCIGLNCYQCVHGTDKPPEICPHSKAMQDGQEHTAEVHEDNLGGDFLVSATPLKDEQGHIIGSVHVARNITIRKHMEKKLEEYSKQLEHLVEERTKQLRDSERLATIGATAGMVGHDIRNPLQAIIGDLYLAKGEVNSFPDNEARASVQESLIEIEKNVEYINKIVADLQDFARPLNPTLTEVNLKHIAEELVNNLGSPKNIQVQSQVKTDVETITADSAYVKRILSNLMNNAIQAMPSGGTLTVQAYSKRNDVIIVVADTGIGIPDEIKPKLFQPLMTTKSKGQGFGLAVVKRMTEALGGTVTCESKANQGTKFIIRLPKNRHPTVNSLNL